MRERDQASVVTFSDCLTHKTAGYLSHFPVSYQTKQQAMKCLLNLFLNEANAVVKHRRFASTMRVHTAAHSASIGR